MKKMLITGGAGFIGSHFARYALRHFPDFQITVFDALTYAGNRANLSDLEGDPRFKFIHGDVRDKATVSEAVQGTHYVVHFAAESHVDRSIHNPDAFVTTDVYGTYVMLEACLKAKIERFVHISTDEVYGTIEQGAFRETDPLHPNSPYASSKAGADLMARAYFQTYGLPIVITRGSNTYGSHQYPEKLIPLFVTNALEDKPLPVYGDGHQVRDWLHVMDHVAGIATVLLKGEPGQAYNVGGDNERLNIEITKMILKTLGKPESLIRYVTDRPGHDRRYALDTSKLRALGWQPKMDFETALPEVIRWYAQNQDWWQPIKTQHEAYTAFSKAWYEERA